MDVIKTVEFVEWWGGAIGILLIKIARDRTRRISLFSVRTFGLPGNIPNKTLGYKDMHTLHEQ